MKRFAFIKPLLYFLLLSIIITTVSRVILFTIYFDRITEVEGYLNLFLIGLRFDLIVICYISLIPFLILTFVPDLLMGFKKRFINMYLVLMLFLIFFMELVTPDFVGQYDTRPNNLFIEYLIYPKEVATMLWKGRALTVIITLLVSAAFLFLGIKKGKKLFYPAPSMWISRFMLFPIVGFLLFWGARGSLTSRRPINQSNSVFTTDQLTNNLALNSLYTVVFAAYNLKNESDASRMYGKMESEEAITRVKRYMNVADTSFVSKDLPTAHLQNSLNPKDRPYNLVIILEESLGAEFVGALGGLPLTPNIDKLSKEGMLFTNLYCTGTRSSRGIEAVITGFLPSPSESVVKLSGSQSGFFTLASLLKEAGYNTSFLYGGMANFDNMGGFFNGNGFDNIIDQSKMSSDGNKYSFKGTWGYSDEDLLFKANEYYRSMGDKPFFSLIFSSSNHDPFEYPEGRIELFEEPAATVNNAIKYADYAIGRFFELAKREDYYKNTVILIVSDHNTRTYGKHLVPVHKFKIPALIIGPEINESKYSKLASQIDLPPTLLDLIGINTITPMPGRDLLQLPDSVPGRAIMQFHNINAFRVENSVVVLQPGKEPLQFEMKSDTTWIEKPLDKEFAKDALAHIAAANYLYKSKKYKLFTK